MKNLFIKVKKPSFWLVIVAVVACITVGIAFVANPKTNTGLEDAWAQDIYQYRTQYVGDSSKVSMITHKLHTPETLTQKGIQLYIDKPPYLAEVKYSATPEIRLNFSIDKNQTFFDESAIIMFALIENVENVNFIINDGQVDIVIRRSRDWAEKVMGQNIWNDSATLEQFTSIYNNIMNKLIMNSPMSLVVDKLIKSGKKTNIQSVNDVPDADNPVKIEVDGKTYYVYQKNGKYYSEQPYQFINEITKETYYKIRGMSPQIDAYNSIISELSAIPVKYSVDDFVKDGYYVMVQGLPMSDINIMEKFVTDSTNGKKASVTTVEYTMEGDPIVTRVLFDGATFYGVTDSSRDAFNGGREYSRFQYKYLKTFEDNTGKFTLLLNDDSFTVEKYRKSMYNSNSKDWREHHFLYYVKQ